MTKIWIAVLTVIAGSLVQINTDIYTDDFFVIYSIPMQIVIYSSVYALLYVRNKYFSGDVVKQSVLKCGWTADDLISGSFGLLLAISFVLGSNLEKYNDIFVGNSIFLRVGLKIFGLGIILASLWHICIKYYETYECFQLEINKLSQVKLFVVICCIIAAAWMPVIIKEWPGILYGDSYNEIYQALGVEHLSTHHPLSHVFFLKFCLYATGGNIDNAVAIYSVISVLMVITILADVLTVLLKRGINAVSAGVILILNVFPSTSFLSMSILKDMLFAAFFVLYILSIYDMLIYPIEVKNKSVNVMRLVIATIGVVITRKNGVYVVMLTIVGYLLYLLVLKNIKCNMIIQRILE